MQPETRAILHVDMDAFFAAIEQRDRKELRGKPVIIGADPKGGRGRGVVSTASYEARRYGIGSAMPISQAYRLCPKGVYLRADMERYQAESARVMKLLERFTELVEPVSIDEAFLDVTASRRALGSGEAIARRLKEDIRLELQLTASVGVATSKLLAKIASDMRKPDGLVVVPPGDEAAFLEPLPVRRLWGVGPKMEERLLGAGVSTIGDLARLAPQKLGRRLGSHGHDLQRLAQGIDERPVVAVPSEAKSLGQEHTFGADTADRERLRQTLLGLADGVARRLRKHDLQARTVTLKYRDETFETHTRTETLGTSTASGEVLFRVAWRQLEGIYTGRRVRLLGVYASGFSGGRQLGLFAPPTAKEDRAQDAVAQRFGTASITRASLLPKQGRGKKRTE
jgi:nucleotidyltransferase/DNA polymerase involved in DNA repair